VRIHITGATGYLGSELLRQRPDASTERVDVRDAAAVCALFERVRPGVVIHTAYRQDGPDALEINVQGSETVARAVAAAGVRLVHLSTDVVFDGTRRGRYREEDEPAPVYEYGSAKADAERLVAAAHPRALIVRTSLIYGGAAPSPHERRALEDDLAFYTDEIRSPVQVGDLAAALLELAGLEVAGPLHVAGADDLNRYEFARLIVAAHGGDPERLRSGESAGGGRPLNCALDSSRATALLRTRLRGAREVLARS
jgi:dTDP-4-dehydrorhamnose reductase